MGKSKRPRLPKHTESRSNTRKFGPLVLGAEAFTVDDGYAILPNGDILTSDGEPRWVDSFQLSYIANLPENKDRKIEFRFRKASADEAKAMAANTEGLVASFAEFKEIDRSNR